MAYTVKFQFSKSAQDVPVTVLADKDESLATQLQSAQDAAGITQEWTINEDGTVAELILTSPNMDTWVTFVEDHLHPAMQQNQTQFQGFINDNTAENVSVNTIIIDEDGNETINEFGSPSEVITSMVAPG